MSKTSRRGVLLGLALVASLGGARDAQAVRRREFRVDDLRSALEGQAEGVSVLSRGALVPGPAARRVFSGSVSYVWALVPDGDGGVYAATGSDGKVFRIRPEGSAEEIAETYEYELFALARASDGTLFFGGAPNGTVTQRTPAGRTETLIDFPEGLIWDLLPAPDGELYAASGESGNLYRVSRAGVAEAVAEIPDAHIVSLAWWQGRIVCGTDARGLLVAVDPASGARQVLFDTSQEEVVAILPRGDRLLFAANGEETSPETSEEREPLSVPVVEVTADGRPSAATLYELGANGLVRAVWASPEKQILSLCAAPDGGVLVGTGSQGVLYALDARWDPVRLADLEEADLLSLATDGERVFVGTGTGGAVYAIDFARPRQGSYTSRVFDAGTTARWGNLQWTATGEGQVAFATRSGQTRDPDETWSDWQPADDGRTASPAARFVQWRLTLGGAAAGGPRVETVSLPYLGPNRPPEIVGVAVSPAAPNMSASGGGGALRQELPGGVRVEYSFGEGDGGDSRAERRGLWTRSLRTAAWKAADPDGDALRYDVYLRFAGEEAFYPLKKDLEDPAWTWESTAWPDGWYQLKLVARDEAQNVAGEGLEAEALSAPFQIDNTPPRLLDVRVSGADASLLLSGRAEDEASRIAGLEFSLDGEGWRPALSADGIFDAEREDFSVPLPLRADGRRPTVVGIRVWDEPGNPATARLRVTAR